MSRTTLALVLVPLALLACSGGSDADGEQPSTGGGDDGGEVGGGDEGGDEAGDEGGGTDDTGEPVDADEDGYPAAEDCDDDDPEVYPGADELCDDKDNDCDEDIDEEAVDMPTWYVDADGDGFGVEDGATVSCEQPDATAAEAGDCDDGDAEVHPDAEEVCGDGRDNDCDGTPNGCSLTGEMDTSSAWATIWGAREDDHSGWGIYSADFDGDGQLDVAVAADHQTGTPDSAGAVYTALGPFSGDVQLATDAWSVWVGEEENDNAGARRSMDAADADGDGYGDLLVSAEGHGDLGGGTVYLVLGPASGEHSLAEADLMINGPDLAKLARDVAIGDVTGDAVADLVLGLPSFDYSEWGYGSSWGEIWVVDGTQTGELGPDDVAIRIEVVEEDGVFGDSPDVSGDLDGDGLNDLCIGGGWSLDYHGRVTVWSAPLSEGQTIDDAQARIAGDADNTSFGYNSVRSGGDLTGDGYDDLVVGDYGYEDNGATWVFAGPVSGDMVRADAEVVFVGETPAGQFGNSTQILGDTDGDGADDLGVGSVYAGGGGTVYAFYGPFSAGSYDAPDDADLVVRGDADSYLQVLGAAGDFNGDGLGDIFMGAHGATDTISDQGAAYLFLGGGI